MRIIVGGTDRIVARPVVRALGSVLLCISLMATGFGVVEAAEPDESIVEAVRKGDLASVRALIARGVDVNQAEGDGMSPLHWAAVLDDVAAANVLLDAGARLELRTNIGGHTPLHVASRTGSPGVAEALLQRGGRGIIDARTTNTGATALHFAAGSGHVDVVRVLLEHGADPNAEESSWNQTPLIFAASNDRHRVVRLLLEHGADPSMTTALVDIPERARLDQAARRHAQQVLQELLGLEEDEQLSRRPTADEILHAEAEAREILRSGVIPAKEKDVEIEGQAEEETAEAETDEFAHVMDYRAQVGTMGGLTALLHAARQGHMETAKALLDGGADINQVSEGHGTSPLLMAAINGQFDLAMFLLSRGADPGTANDAGNTPLFAALDRHWAPRTRYPQPRDHESQHTSYDELMKALLDLGADPNVRLERHLYYKTYFDCGSPNCGLELVWGATPFWRAARALDVDAMRLLMAYGSDPNIPLRQPPQVRARYWEQDEEVEDGSPRVFRPVSTVRGDPSGLDPVPVGGPGVAPIHAVAGAGYGQGFVGNVHRHVPGGWLRALRYLVEELGADVNTRDHEGYTPLHHAAARGDNEMVLYLVEHGADVTALSRTGQTTADMANGPWERLTPFPSTIRLLEELGSKNNNACVSC